MKEKQKKITDYTTINEPFIVGEDKTQKTTINHDKKHILRKQIYGHNFALKFPLLDNCRIPFSDSFYKQINLKYSKQFLFKTQFGLIRQTTKSLIVYPFYEQKPALAGNSFKLKSMLAEKAIKIVEGLRRKYSALKVAAPLWRPIAQEYAVKDSYADKLPFTFENEVGKIDKSPHMDESGFTASGGEVDWKTPEFADAYIRMPQEFKDMAITFKASLAEYNENIRLHLSVLKAIRDSLAARPKMPTPFRASATLRGVT